MLSWKRKSCKNERKKIYVNFSQLANYPIAINKQKNYIGNFDFRFCEI